MSDPEVKVPDLEKQTDQFWSLPSGGVCKAKFRKQFRIYQKKNKIK